MSEDVEPPAPKKKRKKGTSPTARSLAECRKRGWTAQVVEKWNMHAKVLQDLFGCIDIVAITPDGILGIQATSNQNAGHHTRRIRKILEEPRARLWVEAGAKLEVWSWRKGGAAGTRKLWTLRVEDVAPALRVDWKVETPRDGNNFKIGMTVVTDDEAA